MAPSFESSHSLFIILFGFRFHILFQARKGLLRISKFSKINDFRMSFHHPILIDSHFSAFESYPRTSTFQHLNHIPILIVLPIDTTKVQKILTCNHRYVLDFHLLGGGIIQSRTGKGFGLYYPVISVSVTIFVWQWNGIVNSSEVDLILWHSHAHIILLFINQMLSNVKCCLTH